MTCVVRKLRYESNAQWRVRLFPSKRDCDHIPNSQGVATSAQCLKSGGIGTTTTRRRAASCGVQAQRVHCTRWIFLALTRSHPSDANHLFRCLACRWVGERAVPFTSGLTQQFGVCAIERPYCGDQDCKPYSDNPLWCAAALCAAALCAATLCAALSSAHFPC